MVGYYYVDVIIQYSPARLKTLRPRIFAVAAAAARVTSMPTFRAHSELPQKKACASAKSLNVARFGYTIAII